MKRVVFVIFLFIFFCAQLFASGKKDETAVKTLNDEWVLCITNIDAGTLGEGKTIIVDFILKEIVERLNAIGHRTRISVEYDYYEEFAWAGARSTAARALSAKMEERSRLIYQGEPGWRYRQNIKKIDADLVKLRDNLDEIDKNAPHINKLPAFKLTTGNLELNFPTPPLAGGEARFCTAQRADAFLSGTIIDFYGRYLLSVKLYTVYTRSFIWEDSVIFSHNDLDEAITELTRKMIIVLSGNEPAAIAITADPEETLVLINRAFAGRGSAELTEIPPSTVTVTASAPEYESISFETELNADELAIINLSLTPIRYVNMDIFADRSGRVYQGALYVGEAPLTLRLPVDQLEYLEFDTQSSYRGTIVFKTPDNSDFITNATINTRVLPRRGTVDRERRAFYWAFGTAWVTGIGAWIADYSFKGVSRAFFNQYNAYGSVNQGLADEYRIWSGINIGTLIAFGAAAAYTVYRAARYIYFANRPSTPIVVPKASEVSGGE
ncbi:MAG: hypothetical protein FWD26_10665 [Treponema sp.]|nr:hypothetical protein [Treponema sp.]